MDSACQDIGHQNVGVEAAVATELEHDVTAEYAAVDEEWLAAFGQSTPPEVPWRLEDGNALGFGPIPLREVAGYLGTLRSQVNKANESVQGERHRRAMAEYLDAEERARAYRQAMDALSGLFSRRLSSLEVSSG